MTAKARRAHPAKFPKYVLDRIALHVSAEARHLSRPVKILDDSTKASKYNGDDGTATEAASDMRDLRPGVSKAAQPLLQPDVPRPGAKPDGQRRNVPSRSVGAQSGAGRNGDDPSSAQEGRRATSVGEGGGAEPLATARRRGVGDDARPGPEGDDRPSRGPQHAQRRPEQFVADLTGWSSPGAPERIRAEAERSRSGRYTPPVWICDAFAGVGRIHDLPNRICQTVGVELEPEWSACRERTIVGDATQLPAEWTGLFDAFITSPAYGNRLADNHEAKDNCAVCGGIGVEPDPVGCGGAPWYCQKCGRADCVCGDLARAMKAHNTTCNMCRGRICKNCGGNGVSKRYTYRQALGRPPTEGSSATLQWGAAYRAMHEKAWLEAHRVTRRYGLVVINCKNHVRAGAEQTVVEWHAETLRRIGFYVEKVEDLPSPGLRHGENHEARVDFERLIIARRL